MEFNSGFKGLNSLLLSDFNLRLPSPQEQLHKCPNFQSTDRIGKYGCKNISVQEKLFSLEMWPIRNGEGIKLSFLTPRRPVWEWSCKGKGKGKAISLQAWTGPEGSRSLSFPDFKTVGTLTHYSGRVTQICVFNTVKLGTSASSP